MKVFFRIFLGGVVLFSTLAVIGGVSSGLWAYQEFNKPNSLIEPVIIIVPRGANIGGVADILLYNEAIDSSFMFVNAGRFTGQASRIKAGEYELNPALSIKKILDLLENGKSVQRSVTIREGLTSYQIVNLLAGVGELGQRDIEMEIPAEGSLLAETYSYSKDDNAADIIARMQNAMIAVVDELWESRAPDLPIKTKAEAVVLASIIEMETAKPSERSIVAGVFINRLRKGMLLQTDPTVIYALTKGRPQSNGRGPLGRRLLRADLKFDSPYNTYLYAGLPPAPISNTGRAAIEAALNPEQHNYIYFVADGSGGHAFAKNLSAHNNNVAKWRKIRRSKSAK